MICATCGAHLSAVEHGGVVIDHCDVCGGDLVGADALVDILSNVQRAEHGHRGAYQRPSPPAGPVRYRPCPACGEVMNRRNFHDSSGVIVDTCVMHGVSFDAGELSKVEDFARTGELVRADRASHDREARRRHIEAWLRSFLTLPRI